MTDHVYIVARAGECNGVRLSVYDNAISALSAARTTAENEGWTEQDRPTNVGQLYMAHGDGDEQWIEVQQQRVQGDRVATQITVNNGGWADMALADSITGQMRWAGRR